MIARTAVGPLISKEPKGLHLDSLVFRFVRENLAAIAAIAVRFGHVALDLACASMDSPLLRDDFHFVGLGPSFSRGAT